MLEAEAAAVVIAIIGDQIMVDPMAETSNINRIIEIHAIATMIDRIDVAHHSIDRTDKNHRTSTMMPMPDIKVSNKS